MRYLEARLTFLLNDLLSVLSQKPVDNSDYFVFVNLLLLFSPAAIFTFFFSILNFLYLLHWTWEALCPSVQTMKRTWRWIV